MLYKRKENRTMSKSNNKGADPMAFIIITIVAIVVAVGVAIGYYVNSEEYAFKHHKQMLCKTYPASVWRNGKCYANGMQVI